MYYSAWDTGTSCLRKPKRGAVARCKNLLRRAGSGRLLMEIFAGAFILSALASSAGWPCSTPIDVIHDGLDLTKESDRRIVDARIEEQDPFCIVFPFPCGPWNSLTEFNAVRFPAVRERVEHAREEHMPMLRWVARRARDRVRRGRIALLENPATSRALKLDFLEELDGLDDGLVAEALFEYVIGDQCMMGQSDRETGEPFRGRTKWGTNSGRLKIILSTLCDGGHSHQQIMGSNKFGLRSTQKAEWPLRMCRIILGGIVQELRDRIALRAFPAEMIREAAEEQGPLDDDAPMISGHAGDGAPKSSGHVNPLDMPEAEAPAIGSVLSSAAEREQELLDSLRLVGFPDHEQARRDAWLKLPRSTRAAIRRLHVMIGHKPHAVMLQILRGARATQALIEGVKFFRCEVCDANAPNPIKSAVSAPKPYEFNHEVIVDVFFSHDMNGDTYGWLGVICNGTTFHLAALVLLGAGVPSSTRCLKKFDSMWARWAGWPKTLSSDRGLHNRGAFSRGLQANGVVIRQAALEVPEHIGRAERHQGILKGVLKRIVKEHHCTGKDQMKLALTVALETKNDTVRRDGFSPSQWVLAKYPRRPGSLLEEAEWGQLGVLEAQCDATTAFGQKAAMRFTAQRYFVHMDCGRRFRESQLRKARHIPGDYKVGNVVMYKVYHQGARAPGDEWCGPARVIGFENQVVWLQSAGQPVATAKHLLRPCSTPELLAWQVRSRNLTPTVQRPQETAEQEGYIDARDAPTSSGHATRPQQTQVNQHDDDDDVFDDNQELGDASDDDGRDAPASGHSAEPLEKRQRKNRLQRQQVALKRTQAQPATLPAEELMSPLERHLRSTGVEADEPGMRLARTLATSSSALFAVSGDAPKSSGRTDSYVCLMADAHAEKGTRERSQLESYFSAQAYFADRIRTSSAEAYLVAKGSKARQKTSLEKRGKLLRYRHCSPELQALLDKARIKEWGNYVSFGAAKLISAARAKELIAKGAEVLPTQWIERDKNEFKRIKDEDIPPDMKSRLVARGDLSTVFSRSDSPTADKEAIFILFSFASSRRLRIKSGDLDHGYFQGEKLSKPLILRQPEGGLPDPAAKRDDYMLCFVPIYGTRDAGRGLWRRIRKVLIAIGCIENYVLPALYSYAKDGVILVMLASHVDDIIWAADPSAEHVIEALKIELKFGALDEGSFRFCGVEIVQDDDFVIKVTCSQTTKKVTPIAITAERAKQASEPATAEEQEALRSVTGGLMWITRSCRPGLAYDTSALQTAVSKPFVSDVLYANKVAQYAQSTADTGITFRPGLSWPKPGDARTCSRHVGEDDASKVSEHVLEPDICIIACTDASHGGEDEWLNDWQEREAFRSQGAKLIFISDTSILDSDEAQVHLVSFSSTIQKRVVSSTMKAESYQLTEVVEAADLIRAAIADAHGQLDHKDWESSAASWCKSQWLTDCKSCADSLHKPVARGIDKRLGIELASLRQFLWRRRLHDLPDRRLLEELPPDDEHTDKCRWIDTTVMSCDCLTKAMPEDYLVNILDTNTWNVAQTTGAKATKLRKTAGVKRRKAERASDTGDAPTVSGHTERDASKCSEHAPSDEDGFVTADAGYHSAAS